MLRDVFAPVPFSGYRPTLRRLANLYLNRFEHRRMRTRLRSRPLKLVVDPINRCNLRCPCCFTGAGGVGRTPAVMTPELYRRVLDELAPCLFEVELFGWGEPLLSPHIYTMVADAAQRGLATRINTNFSLPFDADKAERLITAGLSGLTVSIDGSRQSTYERYRVRGDLDTVLRNCRTMRDTRRRLRSPTPTLTWEFHVFPHNTADYEDVRMLATSLNMGLLTFKGAVPGGDWDTAGDWQFCVKPQAMPCVGLWSFAVVNSDGGVAPCRGTYYREDDMGGLQTPQRAGGAARFLDVWNNASYQSARRFFRQRGTADADRSHVCYDCPLTVSWERWQQHAARGGTPESFDIGYTTGDAWNYFWNRRPARAGTHALEGLPIPPP
jgi:hypothetical protein